MLKENKRHSISPRWGDQVRHQHDPLSTVSFPESLLRRVHGGALHGWFITLVGAQTQTDWEWVEQSLSFSCLGKPCHHFRCVGGSVVAALSCLFQIQTSVNFFQLRLLCAVQRGPEDLWLLQAEAMIVEASKVASCWSKICFMLIHMRSLLLTRIQEVMEQMDIWLMIIFIFMFAILRIGSLQLNAIFSDCLLMPSEGAMLIIFVRRHRNDPISINFKHWLLLHQSCNCCTQQICGKLFWLGY